MKILDPQSPKPLHVQLEEIIREKIKSGDWTENSRIPSENELSREYGLSRMTVRSVILRLAQEGLLYRVPGKGTFVSVDKLLSRPLFSCIEQAYELANRMREERGENDD